MPELLAPSLADEIACVRREIRMREQVYPRRVVVGKMKRAVADRELETMRAVLDRLLSIKPEGEVLMSDEHSIRDGDAKHTIEIVLSGRDEAEKLYDRLEHSEFVMRLGGTLSLHSYPDARDAALRKAYAEIARLRSTSAARVVAAARELVESKRFPRTTGEILADHYALVEAVAAYDAAPSDSVTDVVEAARKLHELHDLWADGDPAGEVRFHQAIVELFTAVQSLDAATYAGAPAKESEG